MNKNIAQRSTKAAGIRVKSAIKAGGLGGNHNAGIRVKSAIKAGGLGGNHNVRVISAR